jgi:methionyl-tRNA formyltransferase
MVCGQKEFGARVVMLAHSIGHDVVAVSSPLLNDRGDGPDRTTKACETIGARHVASGSLDHRAAPDGLDLIIAAHSHDFIGAKTRSRARLGAVGYHPSLLPRHRGRDAILWALKMGDTVTGGSAYWLNEVMDGGRIAAQEWCWILPGDDAQELWRTRLFPIGLRLMELVLKDPEKYYVEAELQDKRVATFEPACNPPRKFRPDLLGLPHYDSSRR